MSTGVLGGCKCCLCKSCYDRDINGQPTLTEIDCPPFGGPTGTGPVCLTLYADYPPYDPIDPSASYDPLDCGFGSSWTLPFDSLGLPSIPTFHGNPRWTVHDWMSDACGPWPVANRITFGCGGGSFWTGGFVLDIYAQRGDPYPGVGCANRVIYTADVTHQLSDCVTGCAWFRVRIQAAGFFGDSCSRSPYWPYYIDTIAKICPCGGGGLRPLGLSGTADATFSPADPSSSFNSSVGKISGTATVTMSEVGPPDLAGERTIGRLSGEATVVQGTTTSEGGRFALSGLTGVSVGVAAQSTGRVAVSGQSLVVMGVSSQSTGRVSVSGTTGVSVGVSSQTTGRVSVSGTTGVSVGVSAQTTGRVSLSGQSLAVVGVRAVGTGATTVRGSTGVDYLTGTVRAAGLVRVSGQGVWWVTDQYGNVIYSNSDDHPVIIEE